jgi:hypothetical protein
LTSELVAENLDLLNSGRSMCLVYRVVCFVGW